MSRKIPANTRRKLAKTRAKARGRIAVGGFDRSGWWTGDGREWPVLLAPKQARYPDRAAARAADPVPRPLGTARSGESHDAIRERVNAKAARRRARHEAEALATTASGTGPA